LLAKAVQEQITTLQVNRRQPIQGFESQNGWDINSPNFTAFAVNIKVTLCDMFDFNLHKL
jgi:hypothetical protein